MPLDKAAALLARIALVALSASVARTVAAPPSASVCPPRAGAAVSQIDLFDGDPADYVLLAPDDDQKGSNSYSVKSIYDAGRFLTIRCHHGAASTDVKLATPVARCDFSGGEAHPALACH